MIVRHLSSLKLISCIKICLIGCKCFSVVTDHATISHLLKQPIDKLTYRQVHCTEQVMPFAQCTSILWKNMFISLTKCLAALIIHPDDVHLRRPVEMFTLWWDGKVPDLCYQSNDTALLVLSTEIVSVDDDFLTNLTIKHSSCSWFVDE